MFVFLHEQLFDALTGATEDLLTQTNCTSCFICMNFPRRCPPPLLYESLAWPMLFLVRVTDFSWSQNILLILTVSHNLSWTLHSCHRMSWLRNAPWWVFLTPNVLVAIHKRFWCSHLKAAVGASLSKLLVFSCQQTRFDRREQCADWSLLKAIRVKGGVGEPGKKKSSVQSFTQFVFSYLRSEENPGNKFVAPLAKGNLIIAQETPNLIQMIVFPERGRPVGPRTARMSI